MKRALLVLMLLAGVFSHSVPQVNHQKPEPTPEVQQMDYDDDDLPVFVNF